MSQILVGRSVVAEVRWRVLRCGQDCEHLAFWIKGFFEPKDKRNCPAAFFQYVRTKAGLKPINERIDPHRFADRWESH
jgi:hypothetical protein